MRKRLNFSISWNLTDTFLKDLWVEHKLLVQYHSVAGVALKILICESASENLWPVKGRVSNNTIVMSPLSLQAPGRWNHLCWLTTELTVVSLLKNLTVNHPLCSAFFVHISRFGTCTFSHEHRGCRVSPSKLSLWHFQAAGWLQSDM